MSWLRAVWFFYLRSLREMYALRNQTLIAPIIAPLFIMLIFSGLYSEVFAIIDFRNPNLPGFDGDARYIQYFIAAPLLMATFWGTSSSGIGVAVERQIGFYDRLRTSPLGTLPAQLGRRFADGTRVVGFVLILSFVAFIAGLKVPDWPLALGVTLPVLVGLGVAYGGIAYSICLRTGSAESTQAVTPIFLPFLFTSNAFIPVELAPHWLQPLMVYNPLSPICTLVRSAYSGMLNGSSLIASLSIVLVLALTSQVLIFAADRKVGLR